MKVSTAPDEAPRRFRSASAPGGFWLKAYDAFLPIAVLAARGVAPFHRKLRTALRGRRDGMEGWEIGAVDERPAVLFHVASYGEFEGARPLIERLTGSGRCRVAVSYSSPSTRMAVDNTTGIWARGYIPLDYLDRQLGLIGRLEPSVVLVAKHDIWPNMVRAAAALDVPFLWVNANFHPGSRRSLPVVRVFHRAFTRHIKAVCAVSEEDAERARRLLAPGSELTAVGDTRYDRVRQRALSGAARFHSLKETLGSGPVIVAGSTWPPGERICWPAFAAIRRDHPDAKLVIAPHEPTADALKRNRLAASHYGLDIRLFSAWSDGPISESILLIDRVGVLAELYAVGWMAYVGGGFGRGVHSVLEPAAHGLPVTFGPRHYVSCEAGQLLQNGGGFVVKSAPELERLWRGWLSGPETYRQAAQAADGVVSSNEGATDRLMQMLNHYLG